MKLELRRLKTHGIKLTLMHSLQLNSQNGFMKGRNSFSSISFAMQSPSEL